CAVRGGATRHHRARLACGSSTRERQFILTAHVRGHAVVALLYAGGSSSSQRASLMGDPRRSACDMHQRDLALRRSVERLDRFLRWLQQHLASFLREVILSLRGQTYVAFLAATN